MYECSNFYLFDCRKVVYAKSINFCKKNEVEHRESGRVFTDI